MTDKIEIPEEVRKSIEDALEVVKPDGLSPSAKFLYDLIQKQDNEIGVGDWYYTMHEGVIEFDKCENPVEARAANSKARYKKSHDKKLITGLEALRGGSVPIDYKKYPPNWKTEIRPRILERANIND